MATQQPAVPGITLARDSRRTLAGALLSNLGNVLVILLIARSLGGDAIGQYSVGFALRAILVLVCGLGMRVALTRFVAAYAARGEPGAVRGALLVGITAPFLVACAVAAVWAVLAEPLAVEVFGDAELTTPLRLFALSLPFAVVTEAVLAATQGFLTMGPYTWVGQILEPGLRLGLTAVVLLAGGDVAGAAAALLTASVIGTGAALVALRSLTKTLEPSPRRYAVADLASFAGVSWVASVATQGLLWADIVILGALASSAEVGTYQIATRVVLIALIAVTPLTASMAGRIAAAWESEDRETITGHYLAIVLWASRLSLPILAGVAAVPTLVLGLFGDDFGAGRAVIWFLILGGLVEVIVAPSAVVLNQIGRNRLNMTINLCALVANVVLNFALIPSQGINGAAMAWAFTMVVGGAVRIVAVRSIVTGGWPWGREVLVAFVAATVAGAVAASLAVLMPGPDGLRLAVAAVTVLGIYLPVVALLGISRVERDQLVRAVTLRLPILRRLVTRWRMRGARTSDETLSLREIISPFRIDVLARLELFELAVQHEQLIAEDFDAFVSMAYASRYGAWFDEMVVRRDGGGGESETSRRVMFAAIVRASLQRWERSRDQPSLDSDPVSVTRVPAGTSLGPWRLRHDRWVLLDGGHRIALALLVGRTELAPTDYVVQPQGNPPNNTAALLTAERFTVQEVVDFVGSGRLDPQDAEELTDWVTGVRRT